MCVYIGHLGVCSYVHFTYNFVYLVSDWVRRRSELDQQEAELLSKVHDLRQKLVKSTVLGNSTYAKREPSSSQVDL